MIWISLYLLVGLFVAFRTVPWGERAIGAANLKAPTTGGRIVGGLAASLVVTVCWPLYAWAWWRQDALQELAKDPDRETPAVDQALLERALRDLG